MKLRHRSRWALLLVACAVAALLTAAAAARTAAVPHNTAAPTITGTARQGQTVTASNGSWDNSPTSFSYQWQRCNANGSGCGSITDATKQSYTLTSADVDHRVRVVVTATNADGQASAASRTSAIVSSSAAPVNTARPTISGTAVSGEELTAQPGAWTGGVRSFSFHWQRCASDGTACVNVAGATGRTYGVRSADVDHRLRVAVTATNLSGSSATATSAPTAVVGNGTPPPPPPVAGNKAPTISFLSLKRVGLRIYARFRVCDDRAGRKTIIERDNKARVFSYTRRFGVSVVTCGTFARNWTLISRFRTRGRFVVTLRAVDTSGALSRLVSRAIVFH